MKRTISLNNNKDFVVAYKNGKFYCGKHLVIHVLPNKASTQRIGITASKKVGKSVIRNKLKRRVKEAYRELELDIKVWFDIVFVLRRNEILPSFYDIKKEMKYILRKLNMLQTEKF